MKISELHAVLYRKLQWEFEILLRRKVEDPLANTAGRQQVFRAVIESLLRSSRQDFLLGKSP